MTTFLYILLVLCINACLLYALHLTGLLAIYLTVICILFGIYLILRVALFILDKGYRGGYDRLKFQSTVIKALIALFLTVIALLTYKKYF
ncbi:hypothetical protein bcgnr5369_21440 [Bacillus cereus]